MTLLNTVEYCQCHGHLHDADMQTFGVCVECSCPTDNPPPPPPPPWEPPPPTVRFLVSSYRSLFRRRTRYVAWVTSVSIWGMQSQPHFRGDTEQEALEKAKADARKRFPEEMANTTDPCFRRL